MRLMTPAQRLLIRHPRAIAIRERLGTSGTRAPLSTQTPGRDGLVKNQIFSAVEMCTSRSTNPCTTKN